MIVFIAVLLVYFGYCFVRFIFSGFDGFIGNTYVRFPADEYTFVVKVREESGRRVIKDNLWGFRYPSLEPLQYRDRKDFIKMYPDWIRINVEERVNSDICFGQVIRKYADPEQKPLSLYTNKRKKIDGYDERAVMKAVASKIFGLNAMVVPEGEYFKDSSIYKGPQIILWKKGDGATDACTYIRCSKISNDPNQQYCTHEYVDKNSRLVFSMDYSRRNLAKWKDIEVKTKVIFETFKR